MGRRLENRKIAISHDDAEWVSQSHRPSAVSDIKKIKFLTVGALRSHMLHHFAKFHGDRL